MHTADTFRNTKRAGQLYWRPGFVGAAWLGLFLGWLMCFCVFVGLSIYRESPAFVIGSLVVAVLVTLKRGKHRDITWRPASNWAYLGFALGVIDAIVLC